MTSVWVEDWGKRDDAMSSCQAASETASDARSANCAEFEKDDVAPPRVWAETLHLCQQSPALLGVLSVLFSTYFSVSLWTCTRALQARSTRRSTRLSLRHRRRRRRQHPHRRHTRTSRPTQPTSPPSFSLQTTQTRSRPLGLTQGHGPQHPLLARSPRRQSRRPNAPCARRPLHSRRTGSKTSQRCVFSVNLS